MPSRIFSLYKSFDNDVGSIKGDEPKTKDAKNRIDKVIFLAIKIIIFIDYIITMIKQGLRLVPKYYLVDG